jgi:predicted TIM-barrel fold metal-dependent hydrolase
VSQPVDIVLVSANCHLIEVASVFEGRVPSRWKERAPRVVDADDGTQQWVFEDAIRPILRNCAVAGMPKEAWIGPRAVRYEEIRPGCYDARARLADMDLDGLYATAVYPSPAGVGFGGDLFLRASDAELGIACVEAWNDWYFEEWISVDPTRYIPIQVIWYGDPEVAAAEVRRNAARGFKGVTFRNPTDLGLPSVRTGYWDRLFAACEETGTVLCNHTESQPHFPPADPAAPYGERNIFFQMSAAEVVGTWIWGGIPTRFPGLRITIAESGDSWLPHLLDRMQWCLDYSPLHARGWPDERRPVEIVRESFWFSTLEVATAVEVGERFDLAHWMMESDYPHMESVWPDSRAWYGNALAGFEPAWVRGFTCENVCGLFRHDVPTDLPVISRTASTNGG